MRAGARRRVLCTGVIACVSLLRLTACATRPVEQQTPVRTQTETVVVPAPQITSPPAPGTPLVIPVPMPSCACAEEKKAHHPLRHKEAPKPAVVTPPPAPSVAAAPPPGATMNVQVGELQSAVVPILGKRVQGPRGEDLGRVVDLLADAAGHVRVAIIDFGGFLGVGTRRIAVDWPLLHFDPANDQKPVVLDVSRDKLQSAPEYKDSNRPRVLMPPSSAPAAAPAPHPTAPPPTAAASPAPK